MASSKSRILSEEKNPPRAQIFRYFRIESRNNKRTQKYSLRIVLEKINPIWLRKIQ